MNLTDTIRFPFSCLATGVVAVNEAFHRETDSLHDCRRTAWLFDYRSGWLRAMW